MGSCFFSLNRRVFHGVFALVVLTTLASCGGGGSSSGSTSTTTSATGTKVTLSGQAAADSVAVLTNISAGTNFLSRSVRPRFSTVGDTVIPDATVTLIKVEADGTESTVTSTTTDASGDYTIEDVPVCSTSTGSTDDFYYEVRVMSGDLEVVAPVCPSGESETVTANVSPESTVAATIISDVVDVPGVDTNPVPSTEQFELIDNLVENNIGDISESVTVPSMITTEAEDILAFSNGMAGAGGDAEKTYKSFQFESEFVSLTTSDDATVDDMSAYLKRVAREGCLENNSTGLVLSEAGADALAEAMDAETTYTPAEIVAAFNEATNGSVEVAEKVTAYAAELEAIETARTSEALASLIRHVEQDLIDEDTTVAFYTQRDLESGTFASDTEMDPDQSMNFLQTLSDAPCTFNNNIDLTDAIASLTGSDALASPAISEAVIYNDSGFNCNDGAGEGHFMAKVDVYVPSGSPVAINSVVITSTDSAALGGDGTIPLTQDGAPSHYVSQTDPNNPPIPGDCVTIDQEVTYTITASFSDGTTATKQVTRSHPSTPEATIFVNGVEIANQDDVAVATELRPVIGWTPPDEVLAAITTAPVDAQIKYTYELSHMNLDTGTFTNRTGCAFVNSGTALYATDNVIPTIDCDVDACAAADGTTPDKIACRINIQTYLLDENDVLLSQAAGAFRRYCVDTNLDGDCGE